MSKQAVDEACEAYEMAIENADKTHAKAGEERVKAYENADKQLAEALTKAEAIKENT